jgi:hypothetical protein
MGDATPFTEVNVKDIADFLSEYNFHRYGNEVMYNGFTGRKMQAQVQHPEGQHALDNVINLSGVPGSHLLSTA